MDTLIGQINATTTLPAGKERNQTRDAIFEQMMEMGVTSVVSEGDTLGHTLAQISTGVCIEHMTHDSAYVSHKAKKMLSRLVDESSILGCFIGCGVGDAVGLPVEGYGRSVCNQYVHEIVQKQTISAWHRHNFTFGQYSDDTQLTREMFLAVLQGNGKMDPLVYALRIAMLFQPGAYRVVGYGKQTANAALAIRNGKHYTESGCSKGQGNGSVMRSACIGVLLAGRHRDDIAKMARTMSAITHASPASMDGSTAIALAANFALTTRHKPFDTTAFIDYLSGCELIGAEFRGYIKELAALASQDLKEAAERIISIGLSNGERRWGDGVSIGARQTALWALWSFMKSPDNYVDCISYAIAVGGDVDTTAATAGALVGTRVGVHNIPQIWKEALHDLGEWTFTELEDIGKRAYTLVANGSISM
jgi:ADP-ribosylglycohydrolase